MKTHGFGRVGCRAGGLLTLVAALAGACGGDVGREVAGDDGLASSSEAIASKPGCRSKDLVAKRQYQPEGWRDALEEFDPAMSFTLPSELRVTRGNAGNKRLTLAFYARGSLPWVCNYKGGASKAHPSERADVARGLRYQFERCIGGRNAPEAGDTVHAEWILLHLDEGDSKAGPTEVTFGVEEARPCAGDKCKGLTAADLDDHNPCTADTCDADQGPVHTPVAAGTTCSDGDACNGLETCDGAGACASGTAPSVDDRNPCTVDGCDPATGATHRPASAGTSCSDGNACNGAETCDGTGTCAPGTAPATDDGNPCTVDDCDLSAGPVHAPAAAGSPCSDGNACNGLEACDGAGACARGSAPILDDGNPCTADACDPATGAIHTPIAAGTSCADADRCNGDEACDGAGACGRGLPPAVDDGNPCTADACDPATGVSHTALAAGTSCADGDLCNGSETCDGRGACGRGLPPVVDDGNPCTADACDPATGVSHTALAAGTSCADGNACNGAETCDVSGTCRPGAPPAVDDGNPCTADACDPSTGVRHTPVAPGASCSDGNVCNGLELCDGAGSCRAGTAPALDDGNACTADACDPATGVSHTPVAQGTSCSDGNACNGAETCDVSGTCRAGTPPAVDDGNPCTADACDPSTGVRHTPVAQGTSCSDGNACNGLELCDGAGSCAAGTAPALDDGNACTADACDPATGVTHRPVARGTSCSDGNACNGLELCDGAGSCGAGTAPALDDGNACTADACDPATGVTHRPVAQGTSCSDGNACNGSETCDVSGTCRAGTAPALDDGNPCTVDLCDPATGVAHVAAAAGTSCSDGNACNGLELCDGAGSCRAGTAPQVDDGNACTVDSCDPARGVTHTAASTGTSCSDGNVCNGLELCDGAGGCRAGQKLEVNDNNPCTADACDPATGVTHTPVSAGASCSDGNACNGAETCDGAGRCTAGTPLNTDDGNPCTADLCDPSGRITHVPASAGTSCADGNACNGAETCDGDGACRAGTPPVVDDANPCTADSCDPKVGVVHTPTAPGIFCAPPNPAQCKPAMACNGAGSCSMPLGPPSCGAP